MNKQIINITLKCQELDESGVVYRLQLSSRDIEHLEKAARWLDGSIPSYDTECLAALGRSVMNLIIKMKNHDRVVEGLTYPRTVIHVGDPSGHPGL